MSSEELLKLLVAAKVVHKEGESYVLDMTPFNEYGKFVITKAMDPKTERCAHCGKMDHEDCGCDDLD